MRSWISMDTVIPHLIGPVTDGRFLRSTLDGVGLACTHSRKKIIARGYEKGGRKS